MRHCVTRKMRPGLEKSLVNALITHKKVKTTVSRAKKIRPVFEKLITKGIHILNAQEEGHSTLSKTRLLASRLGGYELTRKLLEEVCPVVQKRPGGYMRIVKFSKMRLGDGAQPAIISLVVD